MAASVTDVISSAFDINCGLVNSEKLQYSLTEGESPASNANVLTSFFFGYSIKVSRFSKFRIL